MKFSAEWLRELGGVTASPAEMAQALTRVGLAVDSIEGEGEEASLDVDVPSNRPDCLAHRGLARELAAASGKRWQPPAPPSRGSAGETAGPPPLRVEIEDPALCTRYTALRVCQVRAASSPEWMRRRLERSGMRPRNAVVDITNYVMLETGQPLHAFDFERLRGGRLSVRRARTGETLVTLDGARRTLSEDQAVIADGQGVVALAGLMGGLDSEIRDGTRDVIIESARFDPQSVRRTARALGMRTDASQRFERGLDPEGTLPAAELAAALMAQIAAGRVDSWRADLYPGRTPRRRLRLRLGRLRSVLGMEVPVSQARSILERLEFRVPAAGEDEMEVEPPTHRADVEGEEDLIEEVARHYGYEQIPSTLPPVEMDEAAIAEGTDRMPTFLSALRAHGFTEAICTVFVPGPQNALFADADDAAPLRLLNPLSESGDELRRSLLPGLIGSVRRNLNRGARGVALYETGVVFRSGVRGAPPEEEERLALAAAGSPGPENWDRAGAAADFFDLKGAIEEALERCGWPAPEAEPGAAAHLHPGLSARLTSGGATLGSVGQLHADAARTLDVEGPVLVAEISLTVLGRLNPAPRRLAPIPRTPAVSRDLALVVPRLQPFGPVAAAIRAVDPRITRVQVFDRYESEKLGPGRVGLALHLVYHHPERTLVTQEVEEIENRVVLQLRERFGITLRGN